MSCRFDRVMKEINIKEDVVVCRVSEENIYTVLSTECTSIVTSKKNVTQKVIVIICNEKVVAVGRITDVVEYGLNNEENLWKGDNQAWRSTIGFTDVIMLGNDIDIVFPNTNVKNIETVGYLDNQKIDQLKLEIRYLYGLQVRMALNNIGIVQE